MFIIKDEYNYYNEFNKIAEYKPFPAEVYRKPKEENYSGVEVADVGKEITTTQGATRKKEKKRSDGLIDKIFNSLKGCVATATIAAVAVVGATNIVSDTVVELVELHVESDYIEYQITVEELDENKEYAVVVGTSNEEELSFLVAENGMHMNRVEGLKPEWEYYLAFVSFDDYLGQSTLFKRTFQTKAVQPPVKPEYQFSVEEITIEGLNEVAILFNHNNLDENCLPKFAISYEDNTQEVITLTERELNAGKVIASVRGESTISVTPIISLIDTNSQIEFDKYSKTFTETLEADVQVVIPNEVVHFHLKTLQGNATRAQILDNTTQKIVYNEEIYSETIYVYYDSSSADRISYTLFLTTDDNTKVSNDYAVSFDPSFSVSGQYEFNYKNPSDIGVTYNEDETINVYLKTGFRSDDPNVFYQITLGDMRFTSRDETFSALGIPDDSYGITYDVCMYDDGVTYSIYNVTPSGAVNESTFHYNLSVNISENDVSLSFYSYCLDAFNLSSFYIITSSDEVITITEEQWTYYAEDDLYYCNVTFNNDFEYVSIHFEGGEYKQNMEGIDYVGSLEKENIITISR